MKTFVLALVGLRTLGLCKAPIDGWVMVMAPALSRADLLLGGYRRRSHSHHTTLPYSDDLRWRRCKTSLPQFVQRLRPGDTEFWYFWLLRACTIRCPWFLPILLCYRGFPPVLPGTLADPGIARDLRSPPAKGANASESRKAWLELTEWRR